MNDPNTLLIKGFYEALQKGDPKAMTSFYHKNVVFYDPVYGNIQGDRVRARWFMFLENCGDDFKFTFGDIQANDYNGSAKWTAIYNYGPENRRVVLKGVGTFYIQNGKILQHTDHFDLWTWSQQVFGLKGYLLGWTKRMKLEIQQDSSQRLSRYLQKMNSFEESAL